MNKALCSYRPWDSQFFNCRIAEVNRDTLDDDKMAFVLAWCEKSRIDCLYYLADPGDPANIRRAESHGFTFMDMRMELEVPKILRPGTGWQQAGFTIRKFRTSDL